MHRGTDKRVLVSHHATLKESSNRASLNKHRMKSQLRHMIRTNASQPLPQSTTPPYEQKSKLRGGDHVVAGGRRRTTSVSDRFTISHEPTRHTSVTTTHPDRGGATSNAMQDRLTRDETEAAEDRRHETQERQAALEAINKISRAHGLHVDDLADALRRQSQHDRREQTDLSDKGGHRVVLSRHKVRKNVRRRKLTGRNSRRRRGGVSMVILSQRRRARTRRKQQKIQLKIAEMSVQELRHFLIEKQLIKPSSKAPEDVLRHIARGIFMS